MSRCIDPYPRRGLHGIPLRADCRFTGGAGPSLLDTNAFRFQSDARSTTSLVARFARFVYRKATLAVAALAKHDITLVVQLWAKILPGIIAAIDEDMDGMIVLCTLTMNRDTPGVHEPSSASFSDGLGWSK